MKTMKLFIWDFDGTLLDTYPNTTGYLRQALLDLGHDVPQVEILRHMLDTRVDLTIAYYSRELDLPNLDEQYGKYKDQEREDPTPAFRGVREVLTRIRELGAENFIFTNRNDTIYPLLEREGLTGLFAEVVTSTSPHFAVKPAPDAIFYLMEKYGGTKENTVMIGDRVCDLESGYNAGCRTLHLLTPAVPQYPPCDWRIRDFGEMLEMIK